MPFEKGKSGNPDGRTKGRKNNASLVRDALIKTYGSQEAFVLSLAERSKEDTSIARELFSRISPSLKSVMPTVALDIENNGEASDYHREIVLAAMRGDCPADVAQALAAVVEQMARSETFSEEARELLELAQRHIDSKRGNAR